MEYDLHLDQPWIPAGRPCRRHLILSLQASEAEPPAERPPLDLALVVDRSGSMDGYPLACALEGARRLPDLLRDEDRLSVVDFGSDVRVTLPPARMDARGRRRALGAIESIHCHGCTDLHGGWRTGADTLESLPRGNGEAGRDARVLVLSDGMGNQGITDPAHLAIEATAVRGRGILTTTVGIGDQYSTGQLEALAFNGGGRMHRASEPDQLIGLLAEELQEVRATVAETLLVDIHCPEGVQVRSISACPMQQPGRWSAGALLAGQRRDLVFQLALPPRREGDVLEFSIAVSWCPPGSPQREILLGAASFRAVAAADPRLDRVDPEHAAIVARAWQALIVREAAFQHERGDRHRAWEILQAEEPELRRYLRHVPDSQARVLQEELDDLMHRSRHEVLPQHTSKELLMLKAKLMRGERDLREGWRTAGRFHRSNPDARDLDD